MTSVSKVLDKVPNQSRSLECGHSVLYKASPPKTGDWAYCYRHADWAKVVSRKKG